MPVPVPEPDENPTSPGRMVAIVGLAWLASIGVDFFLHAGVLAKYYVEPSEFLLSPHEAFARIPFGYAAFLLVSILIVWVLAATGTHGCRRGALTGFGIGALVWGAFSLGMYSIARAPAGLLTGWFIGQSAECAVAGAIAGAGLAGRRLGRLLLVTIGLFLFAVILTIAMQAAGLAPAIRV